MNKLVGFTYNKDGKVSNYIYRRNLQGDIIGIYDSLGNEVGGYAYDAYGNCYVKYNDNSSEEEKKILDINPFRYRGYYYDKETGLYYLNRRYYDPSIGRFISPDVLSILDETKGQINGLNLYMYCNNNPIMYVDPSGHFALTTIIILTLIAVGVVAGGTAAGVISYSKGYRGWELVGHIFAGAVIGGLIGAAIGCFAAPTIAGLLASTGTIGGSLVLAGGGAVGGGIAISAIGELALVGTIAVTGISAFGASCIMMFAKTSRQPGKVTSSNKPSWVNESIIDLTKTAQENAKAILDFKYGVDNWPKGPRSEYNKIIKWIERYLKYYKGL